MTEKKAIIVFVFFSFTLFEGIMTLLGCDDILAISVITIWFIIFLYAVSDLNDRTALVTFSISFFVFLLSRVVLVDWLKLFEEDPVFSTKINNQTKWALLISLTSIFIGYIFFEKMSKNKSSNKNKKIDNPYLILSYKKISKILFYISYPFLLIVTLEIVIYVYNSGYLSYYVEYVSRIPYIIKKIADLTQIAFYVYLFTFPGKKEAKVPLILYIIYLFLTLGTGRRYTFVSNLLILFVYFTLRNKRGDMWLRKKTLGIIVVLVPFFIAFLNSINSLRFKVEGEVGLVAKLFDFFYDIGSSENVIKYEFRMGEMLPDKFYSLGTCIKFLRENLVMRLLGVETFSGNNAANALNGYAYTHAMSYLAWGNYYLRGNAMGSSYIAELHHDFSYTGIVVGNLIYAYCLQRFFRFRERNVILNTVYMLTLYNFLLSPRGPFDGFLGNLVDPITWIWILLIYLLAHHDAYNKGMNK